MELTGVTHQAVLTHCAFLSPSWPASAFSVRSFSCCLANSNVRTLFDCVLGGKRVDGYF